LLAKTYLNFFRNSGINQAETDQVNALWSATDFRMWVLPPSAIALSVWQKPVQTDSGQGYAAGISALRLALSLISEHGFL
jgi:hypothetical protein